MLGSTNQYGNQVINGQFVNQQQQRINRLLEMYSFSRGFKQTHHARWKKNYEYYHSIDWEIKSRAEHASKIFVPRPYLVVETKTPKLVRGIVSKDPMFTVLPVSGDDINRAKVSQELLTKQWHDQPNAIHDMVILFKDAFIFGNSIGQSGWEFKQEFAPRRSYGAPFIDPISMSLIIPEEIEQVLTTTVDRPCFKHVDIAEFYNDPTATTIEDSKYMIRRRRVSYNELVQYQQLGIYANVEHVARTGNAPIEPSELDNRSFSLKNLTASSTITYNNDPEYQMVELLECWWLDGQRKMKTVIANRQVIVQDIPLPYWHNRWPFYLLKNNPLSGEFWTMGEIDPIMDLTTEMNDMRNAQSDSVKQFVKAFWVVNRSANIDITQLENMPPGGILEVTGDPTKGVQVLRPPSMETMSFGAQQQIDSDIQITSGANDIAIGQPTRSQVRTATVGAQLAQATNDRFALTGLLFLEQLRKVGRDFLALDQQYLTQPQAVRMVGQGGLEFHHRLVSSRDIPFNYDLFVTLGADLQGDIDLIRQQSMQLFQTLATVPGFQITEYAKEMLSKFGEKDPARFFEGSAVVPTEALLQQMGVSDTTIQSSFTEQTAGAVGGFTSRPPAVRQAAGQPDLRQLAQQGASMDAAA